MTRAEAQVALLEGKKISHEYFADDEFVVLRETDKKLICEKGYVLDKQEFWLLRGTPMFDNNWRVIE